MRGIDQRILDFVRKSIQHWNEGNIDAMSERFREDAALSSPFVSDEASSTWVQGREEIIVHLKEVRAGYENFTVVDAATDTLFYSLLLSDGEEYLTVIVEPGASSLLIRRMFICRSVYHKLGFQLEREKVLPRN